MKEDKPCSYFWRHKWSKWESYLQPVTYLYKGNKITLKEDYLKRICVKCGKIQRHEI